MYMKEPVRSGKQQENRKHSRVHISYHHLLQLLPPSQSSKISPRFVCIYYFRRTSRSRVQDSKNSSHPRDEPPLRPLRPLLPLLPKLLLQHLILLLRPHEHQTRVHQYNGPEQCDELAEVGLVHQRGVGPVSSGGEVIDGHSDGKDCAAGYNGKEDAPRIVN